MIEYEKEFYRNLYDKNFINKKISNREKVIINKIFDSHSESPNLNTYIAELIKLRTNDVKMSNEVLKEYITTAVYFIKKGNSNIIFDLIKNK